MLIRMEVATNPFQSDLISPNQLFKASHRSLKSLPLFRNLAGRGRKKLSLRSVRQFMREISKSPRITDKVILQNLSMEGIETSRSALQRTLQKEELKRCRPRHVKARLYFARKYMDKETSFWSSVLQSD